jgi:copper transport protein
LAAGLAPRGASAHAGLFNADPAPGATLGATPAAVRLSFSEEPEASLSEITVLGPGGNPVQQGDAKPVDGDPLTLSVPMRRLPKGVYTVNWKVVSAVDGHGTDGTYAFGVRASPQGAAAAAGITTASISGYELVSRWILLLGIVALLGGAVAGVARLGGSSGSDLRLATWGCAVSFLGLLLLADAQRRTAGTSLGDLLDTSVGHALIWRGLALAAAAAALVVAWRAPDARRSALAVAATAALVAIIAHVAAGHAAAGSWPSLVTVAAQSAHFAAAGVWFGGLAALLLGIRGAPSTAKATAVRHFAVVALVALIVVSVTGTLRAVDELSSWGELITSGYGRAILAKVLLILLIVGLAARNRQRNVPAASSDLVPLRRTSTAELALAIIALAVAALLGALAPPVSGETNGLEGLSASGADFGTTTRVELTAASNDPGPNLFTIKVKDYDSGDPLPAEGVELRFTPLDDPGVSPSTLTLKRSREGASFVGSGANLAFEGRWGIDVTVQQEDGAVEIPLELDLPGPKYFVSVLRIPGDPPKYTMQIGSIGQIRIEPDPQRAGPSRVYVTCYTPTGSVSLVDQLVLTVAAADGPARQQPVQRLGVGRFVADTDLPAGPVEITVVSRTRDGTRLRGAFQLTIPAS